MMRMKLIIERHDDDGLLHVPYKYSDGTYHMADDVHGKEKHHIVNAIRITDEKEIVRKLMDGYHLRMAPVGRTDADMIAPQNISVRFEKDS
jgi:hypothetical protein